MKSWFSISKFIGFLDVSSVVLTSVFNVFLAENGLEIGILLVYGVLGVKIEKIEGFFCF